MKLAQIANSLSIALAVGSVSFVGGTIFDAQQRLPFELSNGCAHYDMDSGKFTWGHKPLVLNDIDQSKLTADKPAWIAIPENAASGIPLGTAIVTPLLGSSTEKPPAPIPAHKPKVPQQ